MVIWFQNQWISQKQYKSLRVQSQEPSYRNWTQTVVSGMGEWTPGGGGQEASSTELKPQISSRQPLLATPAFVLTGLEVLKSIQFILAIFNVPLMKNPKNPPLDRPWSKFWQHSVPLPKGRHEVMHVLPDARVSHGSVRWTGRRPRELTRRRRRNASRRLTLAIAKNDSHASCDLPWGATQLTDGGARSTATSRSKQIPIRLRTDSQSTLTNLAQTRLTQLSLFFPLSLSLSLSLLPSPERVGWLGYWEFDIVCMARYFLFDCGSVFFNELCRLLAFLYRWRSGGRRTSDVRIYND